MSADAPAIGTLRDRIQLFHKDVIAEAEGGHAVFYIPLATVWARLHARSAALAAFADARGVKATHSVVMRFRNDLAVGDRIGWRGRSLEVLSVEDLNGRRDFVTCACAETGVAG